MQKLIPLIGLVSLAACGVPPEEDAAAKVGFAFAKTAGAQKVTSEDLEKSEAWARLLEEYR